MFSHLKIIRKSKYRGVKTPCIWATGMLTVALFCVNANAQSKKGRPNIIFIIADQMRGDAIGVMGNKNAKTPNLDKMAGSGVMFRNNYANNPVCLPSRVSIFSGRFPNQTGVMCNQYKGKWLSFEKSLPWYLKDVGYRLAYVGKNHAFSEEVFGQFNYTSLRDREAFRAYSKYSPPHWHSDVFWPEEDCNPRKNTDDAIRFINESNSDQPFFLCVSYFDPHPPYMAPATYTQRYSAADMKLPEYIEPSKLGGRIAEQQKALHYNLLPKADLKETMRYYHASVEWGVDHQIGELIKALEKKGIAENTLLVFTADHGDFMGEFNMVRKGMFLYDALLNVPMIWYAPGNIKKGLLLNELTQNVDIFPTLLDFAGVDIPRELVGRSLKDVLQGKKSTGEDRVVFAAASYSDLPQNYWDQPEPYFNNNSDVPFHSRIEKLTWRDQHKTVMVRNKNWKLIISETREPELYHMNGGHIERVNLYGDAKYASQKEYMLKLLDKYSGAK